MAKGRKPGGPKTGGRTKGTPNKATAGARQAIAALVEGNIDRIEGWLARTAIKDPARASDLMIRLLEFHVPKLARSEISGPDGGPISTETRCIVVPKKDAIGYGIASAQRSVGADPPTLLPNVPPAGS
jgi:hypothetical protein